jgi:hypothetical protein
MSSANDWLGFLGGLFGCAVLALGVVVAKLASEVRFWRISERDMRDLYYWQREQSNWLRKQLEDERKRPKDGPYR